MKVLKFLKSVGIDLLKIIKVMLLLMVAVFIALALCFIVVALISVIASVIEIGIVYLFNIDYATANIVLIILVMIGATIHSLGVKNLIKTPRNIVKYLKRKWNEVK